MVQRRRKGSPIAYDNSQESMDGEWHIFVIGEDGPYIVRPVRANRRRGHSRAAPLLKDLPQSYIRLRRRTQTVNAIPETIPMTLTAMIHQGNPPPPTSPSEVSGPDAGASSVDSEAGVGRRQECPQPLASVSALARLGQGSALG